MYHSLEHLERARGPAHQRAEQLRSAPASSTPRKHRILSLLATRPKRVTRHRRHTLASQDQSPHPHAPSQLPTEPPTRPIESLTTPRTEQHTQHPPRHTSGGPSCV
jgi:hypothetical protein